MNILKSKFTSLDKRIRQNSVQLGEDLLQMKEKELWRHGGFESWKDYCMSINKTLNQAWRLTESAKIEAAPKPQPKKPSLPKRDLPKRIEVKSEKVETEKPLVKAEPVKVEKLKDKTGLPIPPEIMDFWNRNFEVDDLLDTISILRRTLERARETKDRLYFGVDIQGCVSKLISIKEEVECAKSYAVCPKCNGIAFEDCEDCRRRGTLSKFHWGMVPKPIKELRETQN